MNIKKPGLFISPDQESSEKAYSDFKTYLENKDNIGFYPSWEIQPYEIRAPHAENIGDRLKTLYDLSTGWEGIICAPAQGLVEPTIGKKELLDLAIEIKKGESIDPDFLIKQLLKMGFTRRPMVEQLGDFAVRGGIIDIFPATVPEPVRIEFFGDEIDSIRRFSVLTQRSLKRLDCAVVLPLREILIDSEIVETAGELLDQEKAIGLHQALGPNHTFDGLEFFRRLFTEEMPSIAEYLPAETIIFFDDPEAVYSEFEAVLDKSSDRYNDNGDYPFSGPDEIYISPERLGSDLSEYKNIKLSGLLKSGDGGIDIPTLRQEPFGSHIKLFVEKVREYEASGFSSFFFLDGVGSKKKLDVHLYDFFINVAKGTRR